jgi:2-iminobutanoate/2-iminopropanoate deaminase
MKRLEFHHTDSAPRAIGPYSQSVEVDGWLYTSGQIALDPASGEMAAGGFEAQAKQVLENLHHVLASAGCTFRNVVKATVYVIDLADFPKLNALYAEAMGDHRPARSTVQVAALPKGALVEIDLVAKIPG